MPIGIEDLGRAPYLPVLERMRALHADVRAGRSPGAVWFVEHDPVYTAGRATPREELPPDVEVVTIERGGRVTFHGPGQLVVYPIVPLPKHDVLAWVRRLEAFGVAVCKALGVRAEASVDGTGVFANGRKVASIGVAVKQWINLHGIALNVAMDLEPWRRVRPCGRDPETMGDLSGALGRPIGLDEAKAAARAHVPDLFAP